MKTFETMNRYDQDYTVRLFSNWLRPYTHEVIRKVLEKRDEIINNEFVMNLLKELLDRSEKEQKDFDFSIQMLMNDPNTFSEYDPHNHPLTHSGSYRDILYDMYIKN